MAEIFCGVKVDAKTAGNYFLRGLGTLEMLENGLRLKNVDFRALLGGHKGDKFFWGLPNWSSFTPERFRIRAN